MKYIIESVSYHVGSNPIFEIRWSTGTTDYYHWTTYPDLPDLKNYRPWYFLNYAGITLFRAPPEMKKQQIFSLNIRNFEADPEKAPSDDLVKRLEDAADEICEASKERCLYFNKSF